MSTEKTFINNLTESGLFVVASTVIGYGVKKLFKKSVTSDPTLNFPMNLGEWVLVGTVGIYAIDYLKKQKIIPS